MVSSPIVYESRRRTSSPETIALRNDIANNCLKAIYQFFDEENGQVAIYDAVNALAADREALAKQFAERDINIMFIESVCDDPKIIENNVKRVKVSSPDFAGWDKKDAVDAYLARVAAKFPHFETIQEKEYYYVKMINAGECIQVNRKNSGYLHGRILFYLMNFHINTRRIYFANSGESEDEIRHKADAPLSKDGEEYALKMVKAIMIHRAEEIKNGEPEGPNPLRPLVIWTSQQQKSIQSGEIFAEMNFPVREMPQLTQLHPGIRETISDAELEVDYPGELENHAKDPYRHRFYRAESYLDVALRLEPVIMQLEREDKDVLIITHESVIRVLYAYLMSCNSSIIPFLSFPRNQILEVIPGSYKNKSNVIKIFDTTEDTLASCAATYPVKKNADTPAESNEQLSKLDIVADSLVNERSKVGLQENKNTD
ncbi:MAG: hypothetical protein M1829_000507 [Trizodia sp. TS-e1964]|nr:MAG: hypothetical protein M1829_000507 [Trizodia sp. TS-e1964]